MHTLCVRLFGRFDASYGEQMLEGLEANKVQELFCYLLVHRDRPQSREALADALWCDLPDSQSRKHLRQTLWQLNTALVSQLGHLGDPVLLVDCHWVRVNPNADLWLDVAAFEQAYALAKDTHGSGLDPPRYQLLRDAVGLYRGELLVTCYQDWCLLERERLHNMHLISLDKLMDYCEASGEYEAALDFGARSLAYEEAREATHRRLMRLHYLAGDRTAALHQYERCVSLLRRELGVEPADSTVALYHQIRSGTSVASTSSFRLLDRLKHLQGVISEVQRQLQREIEALEAAHRR